MNPMGREMQSMKADIAPYLNREWQVELYETPMKSPLDCLFGGVCCCIGAAKQRHELLVITGEPYICCWCLSRCRPLPGRELSLLKAGPCGEPQPEIPCLLLEVFLCPQMALSANRFFVQSRFGLMNTPTDNTLMAATAWIAMCANYAACFMEMKYCCRECFQVDLDGPCLDIQLPVREQLQRASRWEMFVLADLAFLCLNGCMYAQQQVEIDAMQRGRYSGPPQAVLQALPSNLQACMGGAPQQLMMPDLYVGLHCTHGLNRTGFVVAAYLMTRRDVGHWKDAVAVFEKARGGKMDKAYLFEALQQLEEGKY
eukprot:s800_g28.t1